MFNAFSVKVVTINPLELSPNVPTGLGVCDFSDKTFKTVDSYTDDEDSDLRDQ